MALGAALTHWSARMLVSAALLLFLAGCVTHGRPTGEPAARAMAAAPPAGQARLVFYRDNFAFLGAIEPDIVVNGRRAGTARVGEVFERNALPGRYQIFSSHNPDHVVEVTLEAGEEAYIKIAPRLSGLSTKMTAVLIAENFALEEIEGLTMVHGPGAENAN